MVDVDEFARLDREESLRPYGLKGAEANRQGVALQPVDAQATSGVGGIITQEIDRPGKLCGIEQNSLTKAVWALGPPFNVEPPAPRGMPSRSGSASLLIVIFTVSSAVTPLVDARTQMPSMASRSLVGSEFEGGRAGAVTDAGSSRGGRNAPGPNQTIAMMSRAEAINPELFLITATNAPVARVTLVTQEGAAIVLLIA